MARLRAFVFVTACVTRLAAGLAFGNLRHPEVFEYDDMARALVAGKGTTFRHLHVVYHSFAPPLYAWLSAASYWSSKSILPLMLLQILAGSALAVVVAEIARRIFGGWIAPLSAGLLVAFHPGLIIYCVAKAHPLTFDALFFSLSVFQALRLRAETTVRRAIEFGAIVGLGSLCRATLIIFLPLAALWLLLVLPQPSLKSAVRAVVIAGLCTTALIAPWSIRTSLLHHRFVFMLTTDSEDFWRGNHLNARGSTYIGPGTVELDTLSTEEYSELSNQPDEIAQADWFSFRSRSFIREHKSEFVRLIAVKLFYFWWMGPQTGVLYPGVWLRLYMIYYIIELCLAIFGIWSIWKLGRPAKQNLWLIVSFLFALSLLQSLYYVEGRHRWAVEPILIAISGGGVALWIQRHRQTLKLSV